MNTYVHLYKIQGWLKTYWIIIYLILSKDILLEGKIPDKSEGLLEVLKAA